jgi:hypothetical protein
VREADVMRLLAAEGMRWPGVIILVLGAVELGAASWIAARGRVAWFWPLASEYERTRRRVVLGHAAAVVVVGAVFIVTAPFGGDQVLEGSVVLVLNDDEAEGLISESVLSSKGVGDCSDGTGAERHGGVKAGDLVTISDGQRELARSELGAGVLRPGDPYECVFEFSVEVPEADRYEISAGGDETVFSKDDLSAADWQVRLDIG